MTYWKVTDKISTGTVNFWECTFLKFCVLIGLNLKVLFSDLCVRWNPHSVTGFKWKKDKIFHSFFKFFQVFHTLSSKFLQIIANFTEDTGLASTERLERLYLIIILLIMLLSHILKKSNSNFVIEFPLLVISQILYSLQKFFHMQLTIF